MTAPKTARKTAAKAPAKRAGKTVQVAPAAPVPDVAAGGPQAAHPGLSRRLTDRQLRELFGALAWDRVSQTPEGFSHLQQWDVRRTLLRVFGFGGFDTEILSVDVVREAAVPAGPHGPRTFSVIYRVHQRLTVKDIHGVPLSSHDGVATGVALNVASLAEAHDNAVKEADSQSLKRAAVNLGDQFGLSLYNQGSIRPVVRYAAPYEIRYEGGDEAASPAGASQASVPGPAGSEPRSEAEAPQRDFLAEIRDAPDAATAWGIRREASKAGAARPYLDELTAIARTKPKVAGPAKDGTAVNVAADTGADTSDAADTGADTADTVPQDARSRWGDASAVGVSAPPVSGPDVSGDVSGVSAPQAGGEAVDGEPAPGWDTAPGASWVAASGTDPWATPPPGAPAAEDSPAYADGDHAAAVKELTAAAADRGITDIDAEAYARWGVPLDDASTDSIRRLTQELRGNAA